MPAEFFNSISGRDSQRKSTFHLGAVERDATARYLYFMRYLDLGFRIKVRIPFKAAGAPSTF